MADIANNWKALSGVNNWNGLLEPLDNNLGEFIKLCGKGVQAIYDSINDDELPQHENKGDVFSIPELRELYEVKEYIYAWVDVSSLLDWLVPDRSAWLGYVAVATKEGKEVLGRRDILICWRGTESAAEWQRNFVATTTDPSEIFPLTDQVGVHEGFYSLYTHSDPNSNYNKNSARDHVMQAVKNLVNEYPKDEISITVAGHSLGAALATLNAVDIVSNRYNRRPTESSNEEFMVTVFVFGSPKVGDEGFRTEFNKLENLHLLQIKHVDDFLTRLPPIYYVEVQSNELNISSDDSTCDGDDNKKLLLSAKLPKLSSFDKISKAHNLKNYLAEIARRQKSCGRSDL